MNRLVSELPRLTSVLIALSLAAALFSRLGYSHGALRPLLISIYVNGNLPEIQAGQIWRLLTPIFIHFGLIHLVFNMLWLWDLGTAIERVRSSMLLGALVIVIGVTSNLAQYIATGYPMFGGMSGVVYGLLGFIWMQGRFNRRFGLGLRKPIVIMMLAWFVLCWTGLVGPIANVAHTAGLLIGVVWGITAAWFESRH